MCEIERRLDKLEAQDVDRRLVALGIRTGRLEEKMASVAQLEAGLATQKQAIADLGGRIAGIVQTSADLKAQVTDLQAKLAAGAEIPDQDVQDILDNATAIQQMAQASS